MQAMQKALLKSAAFFKRYEEAGDAGAHRFLLCFVVFALIKPRCYLSCFVISFVLPLTKVFAKSKQTKINVKKYQWRYMTQIQVKSWCFWVWCFRSGLQCLGLMAKPKSQTLNPKNPKP